MYHNENPCTTVQPAATYCTSVLGHEIDEFTFRRHQTGKGGGGATMVLNCIHDALITADLSALQYKILHYLMRNTFGWHKDSITINVTALANMIEKSRGAVSTAINRLIARQIVVRHADGALSIYPYTHYWQTKEEATAAPEQQHVDKPQPPPPCHQNITAGVIKNVQPVSSKHDSLTDDSLYINNIYLDNCSNTNKTKKTNTHARAREQTDLVPIMDEPIMLDKKVNYDSEPNKQTVLPHPTVNQQQEHDAMQQSHSFSHTQQQQQQQQQPLPDYRTEEVDVTELAPLTSRALILGLIPPSVAVSDVSDFELYRLELCKVKRSRPMTFNAMKIFLGKLKRFSDEGLPYKPALDKAIEKGWESVYGPWDGNKDWRREDNGQPPPALETVPPQQPNFSRDQSTVWRNALGFPRIEPTCYPNKLPARELLPNCPPGENLADWCWQAVCAQLGPAPQPRRTIEGEEDMHAIPEAMRPYKLLMETIYNAYRLQPTKQERYFHAQRAKYRDWQARQARAEPWRDLVEYAESKGVQFEPAMRPAAALPDNPVDPDFVRNPPPPENWSAADDEHWLWGADVDLPF